MDEPALQRRLRSIERRQSIILGLLVLGYVTAGAWFLTAETSVVSAWTVAVGAVACLVLGLAVGVYRRRATRA